MNDSMNDMQILGSKFWALGGLNQKSFCKGGHGELTAKKWLNSIKKQKKESIWSLSVSRYETNTLRQMIDGFNPSWQLIQRLLHDPRWLIRLYLALGISQHR